MAPRKQIDWEAIEREYRAGQMSVEPCRASEAAVEEMAAEIIPTAELRKEMGWPPVLRIGRQIRVKNSILDLLAFHGDGSLSVIEVKRGGLSLRDYCIGIGQLAYQSQVASISFKPTLLRSVLALPGPISLDVAMAAMRARIELLPLPTVKQWEAEKASAREHNASLCLS